YRNLADYRTVSAKELAHLGGLADAVAPAPVVWVPFLSTDVHDIAGVGWLPPCSPADPMIRALLVNGGGRLVEGGGGRFDGLLDGDDAVEARGVQQAGEGGGPAGPPHAPPRLPRPADAPDQGTEPRRVHERHRGKVDEQVPLVGQLSQGVSELPDRVGVELAYWPADRVTVSLVNLNVEHLLLLLDPIGDRSGGSACH